MTPRRAAAALARDGFGVRPAVERMTAEEFRLTEPEASFMAWVIQFAEIHGWAVFHDTDSRKNTPGFPDLVLTRRGVLIFAELKTVKGRLTREQELWLARLDAVPGIEVHLWRPTDRKEIEAILTEAPRIAENDRGMARKGNSNAQSV